MNLKKTSTEGKRYPGNPNPNRSQYLEGATLSWLRLGLVHVVTQ